MSVKSGKYATLGTRGIDTLFQCGEDADGSFDVQMSPRRSVTTHSVRDGHEPAASGADDGSDPCGAQACPAMQ